MRSNLISKQNYPEKIYCNVLSFSLFNNTESSKAINEIELKLE